MKNRKHRPLLFLVILLPMIIVAVILGVFLSGPVRWLMFFCALGLTGPLIFILTYYIMVTDTEIIIKQGLLSNNRQYRTSTKTHCFKISDVVDVRIKKDFIGFELKDHSNIVFSIEAYLNKKRLVSLFSDIKNQIENG